MNMMFQGLQVWVLSFNIKILHVNIHLLQKQKNENISMTKYDPLNAIVFT